MKFLLTICYISAMVLCLLGTAYSEEIIYSQNFDTMKDGDLAGQDGWGLITALEAGIASPTIQSKVALKGKAVQVEPLQEAYISWPKSVPAGICYLSIFFRKETADTDNTLHIYMGQGALAWTAGPVIRIGSQAAGAPDDIGVHNGSDAVIERPAKYVVGKWHHIREVVDVDKQTFDVYLDGKKIGNFKFRNAAAHKTIEWLMIGFDAGVGLIGYYDAVEFGLGEGTGAFNRAAPVESAGKLSATWGELKIE